jgi:hypothetical protein
MQHTAPIRKLPAGCAQPADPQGRSVTVACKEMLAPRPYRKSETSQVRYLPRLVRTPSIASCLPGVKPHPSRTRLVGLPWRWYLQTARRRGALTFFSPSACLMLSQCGALTSPSPYRCPSSPAVPPLHTCAALHRQPTPGTFLILCGCSDAVGTGSVPSQYSIYNRPSILFLWARSLSRLTNIVPSHLSSCSDRSLHFTPALPSPSAQTTPVS